MVLHPIAKVSPGAATGKSTMLPSAWSAVERRQRAMAAEWWLISQPDHAALSAALAANFVSSLFPAVDPLLASAIEVHDAGWAMFAPETEAGEPALDARGKPVSFIEIEPADFLRAWTASIERAEQVCAAGGYIVSRHFCVLGRGRLEAGFDAGENAARLKSFLERESLRQQRLSVETGRAPKELDALLGVLQFCDLLSLFLCCGANEAVEFPYDFGSGRVRLLPRKGGFALEPSPFRRSGLPHPPHRAESGRLADPGDAPGGLSVGVRARRYPASATAANSTTMAFLLW